MKNDTIKVVMLTQETYKQSTNICGVNLRKMSRQKQGKFSFFIPGT